MTATRRTTMTLTKWCDVRAPVDPRPVTLDTHALPGLLDGPVRAALGPGPDRSGVNPRRVQAGAPRCSCS